MPDFTTPFLDFEGKFSRFVKNDVYVWLVVGRNARNIVEVAGKVYVESRFGSSALEQMWVFFKAMSSWEKYLLILEN